MSSGRTPIPHYPESSLAAVDQVRPEDGGMLDPADWEGLRKLGHRMVDDMLAHLRSVRSRPTWQPVPEVAREALEGALPKAPRAPEAIYADFQRHVLPYGLGNTHPRFWGWANGGGTPFAALGGFLTAALNTSAAGFDQASTYVEMQVVRWLADLLELPLEGDGILLSGGSLANFTCLYAALVAKGGRAHRAKGVSGWERPPVVYCSTETHFSVARAVELTGLGSESVRALPTDQDFRLDVDVLRAAIADDVAAGKRPMCIVGTAGTVSTGAVDDLEALSRVAEETRTWFHVDGALGAFGRLSPRVRELYRGMEKADSVAFDLHKWLHVPLDAGCAYVRDAGALEAAFAFLPSYLARSKGGLMAAPKWYGDRGPELTRRFRALEAWMALQEHGADRIAAAVDRNVAQAGELAELVRRHARLELMAPVSVNVVCFRYVAPSGDEASLEDLNKSLLVRLQEGGSAVVSSTTVRGRFALRACLMNHRTRSEDLELLVEECGRLGAVLSAEAEEGRNR